MKKLLYVTLLDFMLAVLPTAAFAYEGKPSMDRFIDRGWTCVPIGEMHCFNPASGKSENTSSIPVKVFDDGKFLGTEILWRADLWGGQQCPQDHLLTPEDLHIPYYACHHYSH